jgi:hypothetical protein
LGSKKEQKKQLFFLFPSRLKFLQDTGFFSPGLRTRFAHLRTQFEDVQPPECTWDNQSQANDSHRDPLFCPVCGQILQKLKTIPAQVRQPP